MHSGRRGLAQAILAQYQPRPFKAPLRDRTRELGSAGKGEVIQMDQTCQGVQKVVRCRATEIVGEASAPAVEEQVARDAIESVLRITPKHEHLNGAVGDIFWLTEPLRVIDFIHC